MRMETSEEKKDPKEDPRKERQFLILPMTAFLAELEWKHFILFKIRQ